jgi:hypothetical protein
MGNKILRLCYLCSEPIENEANEDHVVPKQFIKRNQPKVKGFEYGGVLETHTDCNNKFGGAGSKSEVVCQKALHLIRILHDENCFLLRERKSNPKDRILAINSECLKSFTKNDLEFFELIDVRHIKDLKEWTSHEFLSGHKHSDTFKKSINITLSVLAKSAAAFLVSRFSFWPEVRWRIMAIPYFSKDFNFDFDSLFGAVKPFEIGVKLWVKKWNDTDWFTSYKVHEICIVFNFINSRDSKIYERIQREFQGGSKLVFQSEKLINLIGHDWAAN